ncbi:MAG: glutathione S-transferase N-terminal domain-containing protein, partial [Candidatus Marinimicrobia bacterium]|nr:glutathione S-transferase N-terminal domain-containing protein [Candidatus Neomarinimicrobiota bacterium]
MYKVYGMMTSGNCYKVRLLLAQLGEDYDWEEIPSTRIKPRTPEFLKINPDGKVPVLVTKEGELLRESNAILCYLGEGTP